MGNIFSGSEIVEIGILIEKNGRDFYNALVEKFNNAKAKEAFSFLSKEEEKHIKVFGKILEAVEKYEPAESYPGEYLAYMTALSSEHIFTKENQGKAVAMAAKSDKEAIDLGIGFEKDSIIFYEGMKKVIGQSDLKVVDQLIVQEQLHLKMLVDLKRNF